MENFQGWGQAQTEDSGFNSIYVIQNRPLLYGKICSFMTRNISKTPADEITM